MIRNKDIIKSDKLKRGISNVDIPLDLYGKYKLPCYVQDLETCIVWKAYKVEEGVLYLHKDNPCEEKQVEITKGSRCRVRYVRVSPFVGRSLI